MVLAAFLCGFFYGAFGYAVYRKAEWDRRLDQGMAKLMDDLWGEPCTCDECCGCGERVEAPDDTDLNEAMECLSTLHCQCEPMIIYGQCSSWAATGTEDG